MPISKCRSLIFLHCFIAEYVGWLHNGGGEGDAVAPFTVYNGLKRKADMGFIFRTPVLDNQVPQDTAEVILERKRRKLPSTLPDSAMPLISFTGGEEGRSCSIVLVSFFVSALFIFMGMLC